MGKRKEKIQWFNQAVNMVAIIIGVYIGFKLNDWQIIRQREVTKKEYVQSLKDDLLRDKKELEDGISSLDTLLIKIAGLRRYKEGDPHDSLNDFIQGLMRQPTFYPINFTFQSLVNSGDMGGLHDLTFKRDILELYNGKYALIKELDEVGLKNFQDNIITMIIERGGALNDEYVTSASFKALAMVVGDFHRQRKKIYLESLAQIDKILTQIELGAI